MMNFTIFIVNIYLQMWTWPNSSQASPKPFGRGLNPLEYNRKKFELIYPNIDIFPIKSIDFRCAISCQLSPIF